MSNLERQRRFCESHPGYYRKYSAQRKALEREAHLKRELAAQQAQEEMRAKRAAEHAAVAREPLMLPAPVEMIKIPGMTTINVIPAREPLSR